MDLSWLYPPGFSYFSIILLSALLLDWMYPKHEGFLYYMHPVHTSYALALFLHRRLPKSKAAGVAIWICSVGIHLVAYGLAMFILRPVSQLVWMILSIYIMKVSISQRLLIDYVREASDCLKRGDVQCARESASNIVRRDLSRLGEGYIASAGIESLFESMVDGFISPLFFYLLLGPLGALLQRLANTMDSALGYKDDEFREKGWASAKMDTILNFIPARIGSLITVLLCPCVGGKVKEAWAAFRKYRNCTESINAGNPMSAASGCLRIKLEKHMHYTIGKEFPLPSYHDLERALRLALCESLAFTATLLALSLFLYILF
ncbi:MAG: CobD/CbiB family cobalamin biosynthesis protein [Fervidicoccus sp.]|nr:MAG: CobD/CbiB family cobalamin biosynthesis protein [Fervidicoccus sp.]